MNAHTELGPGFAWLECRERPGIEPIKRLLDSNGLKRSDRKKEATENTKQPNTKADKEEGENMEAAEETKAKRKRNNTDPTQRFCRGKNAGISLKACTKTHTNYTSSCFWCVIRIIFAVFRLFVLVLFEISEGGYPAVQTSQRKKQKLPQKFLFRLQTLRQHEIQLQTISHLSQVH